MYNSCALPRVPLNTLVKLDTRAAEAVQGTPNGKVHLSTTEPLDGLEVLQVPTATRVRHGDGAPFGEPLHELLVDALLQSLVVGSVDEEL